MTMKKRDWVYGWWDGKQVATDKYVPPKTEDEELEERRKERLELLEKLRQKKREMAQASEQSDQLASTSREENVNTDDQVGSSSSISVEVGG